MEEDASQLARHFEEYSRAVNNLLLQEQIFIYNQVQASLEQWKLVGC